MGWIVDAAMSSCFGRLATLHRASSKLTKVAMKAE